jgi:hypothetical protein
MSQSDIDRHITGNDGEDGVQQDFLLCGWRTSFEGGPPSEIAARLHDALEAIDNACDAVRRVPVRTQDYVGRREAYDHDRRRQADIVKRLDDIYSELEQASQHIEDHIAEQEARS